MSVRFQRPMGAVLAGLLLFGGVSLVSVIAGSVPASAVQTNVLRTGSVSGPAVSVGDVLTETISLSSVDGVIRCPQGTAQETVTSNPTAPGTAQLSLVAFSPTDCTYAGFPLSLVAQNLPTTLSVSDGTGNPVLTGPIQVSEAFCTGYSPGLSGSWSNTANAMTFTDQFFSVISGGCAGVAFNVTLGSIVDSTVNGSPEVFVADVSGTVTAMNQSYTAAEGVPITEPSASLELGSSDTDPNPSAQCCDAALVTAPANGTVVVNPDGGFTYTPDAGFSGHDSFTFSLTDTDGNMSAPATVTIPVLANCNVATWAVTGTFPVAPQDAKGFYIGQDGGDVHRLLGAPREQGHQVHRDRHHRPERQRDPILERHPHQGQRHAAQCGHGVDRRRADPAVPVPHREIPRRDVVPSLVQLVDHLQAADQRGDRHHAADLPGQRQVAPGRQPLHAASMS